MTQIVHISATAGPDLAAIINAALADPNVTTVILDPGLFLLHSSIIVPSGKTLMGSGREDTILRAAADFTWPSVQQNAVIVSENYSANITISDLSVDANRVSPGGLRLNGILMRFTQDFLVERVDVSNATGYANYAIGDLGAYFNGGPTGNPVSGRYEDMRTYNSQVHFEQYFADGITLFNVQASDGDGDISTEAYFHPIVGSRNITFEQVSGVGAAFLGFSLISSVLPLENIFIIDSHIEIMHPSQGSALISLGALPVNGLFIDNSSFIAYNYIAFRIGGVTGTATNSYFQGGAFAIEVTTSGDGTPSQFVVTDSDALGVRDAMSGFGVAGVHSDFASYLIWNGGSIEARAGLMFPISGRITRSPTTQVIGTGHDIVATYTEDTVALTVFASANFGITGTPDLNGATIQVQYLSHFSNLDNLALLTQGLVSITGSDVFYNSVLVGTVSGGTNGSDLLITLNAAATPAIAESLLDSIAFSNPSDTPYTTARLFSAALQIVGGGYFEITSSVRVVAVNDAPVVDLTGAGPAPAPVYAEDGLAIALTPDAVVTDVDSTTLAGGTLTISIGTGYEVGDALQVTTALASPTGILVTGNVVSYLGTNFATISSDGSDGSLVITLGTGASLAAVQALIRAIEFSGTNNTPGTQARTVTFLLENGAVATNIQPTVQVTVNAVDDPTVAVADTAAVGEYGTIAIDIRANDSDVDSPLEAITMIAGTAAVVDEWVTLLSGARVRLTASNGLDYDPNGAFAGTEGATAVDSFSYTLAGGGTATVEVTVTLTNDAPVVDLTGAGPAPAPVYAEDGLAIALTPDAVVTDVDSTTLAGGTLTISIGTGYEVGDALQVTTALASPTGILVTGNVVSYLGTNFATISSDGSDGSLVITLGTGASLAAVQALIRAIEFSGTNNTPGTQARTVTFLLENGAVATNIQPTVQVTVNAVDDPTVAVADTAAVGEYGTIAIDIRANDSDVDSPLEAITMIAGTAAVVDEWVTLLSGARVRLTASNGLDYDPNGAFAGTEGATAVDSFSYTLAGGGTATVEVTVTLTNDAPVVDLTGAGPAPAPIYAEDGLAIALTPDAVVTDVDSTTLAGGTLTISIGTGYEVGDALQVTTALASPTGILVTGNVVSYLGTNFATISSDGSDGSLVITLGTGASLAAVQALIRAIEFSGTNNTPGTQARTVTFLLENGAVATNIQPTVQVTVNAVDDPTVAVADTAAVGEYGTIAIDIRANDSDVDSPLEAITMIAGTAAVVDEWVTLLSGARVRLTASNGLDYDPNGAFAGTEGATAVDSFSYTLAGGGTATVEVTVTLTNDAPVVDLTGAGPAPAPIYAEDGLAIALTPDAVVTDVDSTTLAGGTLTISIGTGYEVGDALQVTTALASPTGILVTGNVVSYLGTNFATISSDGSDGSLVITLGTGASLAAVQALIRAIEFSGTNNTPGTQARTVTFLLENGAVATNIQPTVQVTVNAVDDPTVAVADTAAVGEYGTIAIDIRANDSDVDSPLEAITMIAGTAAVVDEWVTLLSGARVRLTASNGLDYDPNGAFAGTEGATAVDSFSYTLAGGGTATVEVTVTLTNDAPVVDLTGAGPAPAPVYAEDGLAIALTPDAVVTDVDSTTLAGGTLTISIGTGYEVGDALQVTTALASPTGILVTGNVVSYLGTNFATISSDGSDGSLVITLGTGASLAAVQALIRAIEFSGTNNTPGAQARTVTFLLENGAVATNIQPTVQVTVNAVDDPSVAVADTGAVNESGTVLINALSNDTDVDAFLDSVVAINGQAIMAGGAVILASGARVTLTLDGQLLYDPNGAFDYLASPTSGTALTTAADSFTYRLSGGATAQVAITLTGETSSEDVLRGDGNANILSPSLAGQTLQGMAGADTLNDANLAAILQGGPGDDLYFIDNNATTMLELSGEGTDTVRTTRTNLTLTAHVENLFYIGSNARFYGYGNSQNNIIEGGNLGDFLTGYAGDDTLRGGAGNDVLDGGAGHDVLNGGTGGDAMIGGAGNDLYHVDSVNDQIIEGANQGFDRISTTLTSYTIPNWVENLIFSGTAAYTGTGNAVGNEIAGSINGDTLFGLGGNDRLIGFGGNDILNGGEGDDILQGGIGSDQLTGGTGADRFRFDTALSLTNIDMITDFEHGVDRIELSRAVFAALGLGALSATAFVQGTAAQNANQRIIYNETTGSLYYDADGDGAQAAIEFARVAPFTPLDAGDIFII